jgi:hypothetical protein
MFPRIYGTLRSATIAFCMATMFGVGLSCTPSPSHRFGLSKAFSRAASLTHTCDQKLANYTTSEGDAEKAHLRY